MSSPSIEYDYFLISHYDKKEKKEKDSRKELEDKIKASWGL